MKEFLAIFALLAANTATLFAAAVPAYDTLISHRGESVDAPGDCEGQTLVIRSK